MNVLLILLVIIEGWITSLFLFPLFLKLIKVRDSINTKLKHTPNQLDYNQPDYAIVVTVFRQTDLLNDLIDSINDLNYSNFMVYIVLDNCEAFTPENSSTKIVYLTPKKTLANNVKSHQYAIENFVREHERITIIDSDNLIDSDYLLSLNRLFSKGYFAIQGARRAKNKNSSIAKLDAVGDLYYRYVDRKLLFDAGSSSTLSGSGMAFTVDLYSQCLEGYEVDGAGFDKFIQYKIVSQGFRIAFSNDVIVYDQKTVMSDQLVKQRARWIKTWFKSFRYSVNLLIDSVHAFDRNKFLFSITLLRPPLFLTLIAVVIASLVNLIVFPQLNVLTILSLFAFVTTFYRSLKYFERTKISFDLFFHVPQFVFLQLKGLINVRKADRLSVATEHLVIKRMKKDKFRILHTIRQGEIGGGETHVFDLVRSLDKDRYQSYILAFSEGQMVDKLRELNFKVFVIPTARPFDFNVRNKVDKLLNDYNIDIVHAHGTRALSNSIFSAKRNKTPVIYTVHGWSFHPDQNFFVNYIRSKSERFLINRVNQTICVSKANLQEGVKRLGKFRYTIIKNGVDRVKFNPDGRSKDIRSEMSISKNSFLIGFIGRVTKQKNPVLLLEAVSKLPDNLDIKLLIVGNGELDDVLISKCEELKIEDKVIFSDFRADIDNVLNTIDVYCLPSLWEGLSIGLLEAMSMRKTIIASDVAGNTEVIEHMKNGYIIPQCSEKLAEAILYLYNNSKVSSDLALNAFETICNDFQIGTMADKVGLVYDETFLADEVSTKIISHNQYTH